MEPRKLLSPTILRHLDRMERVARKHEDDLVASGRFKYVRSEGNRNIYVEIATGREVPVLIPHFELLRH